MEVKRDELKDHARNIARVFASICEIKLLEPLIQPNEFGAGVTITIVGAGADSSPPRRIVTSDLGNSETVIGLPVASTKEVKFWIGLHESWRAVSKRRVAFLQCGLRLYVGEPSEPGRQFLRLEWVAPEIDKDGLAVYHGAHAGHPHWHIDRAALVGPEERWRSLELLTAPVSDPPVEVFGVESFMLETPSVAQDLSWLSGVHLPAQAQWMHLNWDGQFLPGPHQSTPTNLEMLRNWWEGSLRYIFAELSQHGF